jgi:hypothetical protein
MMKRLFRGWIKAVGFFSGGLAGGHCHTERRIATTYDVADALPTVLDGRLPGKRAAGW